MENKTEYNYSDIPNAEEMKKNSEKSILRKINEKIFDAASSGKKNVMFQDFYIDKKHLEYYESRGYCVTWNQHPEFTNCCELIHIGW
jgi:hypothetical protein